MPGSSARDRLEAAAWLAVFTGLTFLYPVMTGWRGWMLLLATASALASTAVLMFTAGFIRGFIRDTRPRAVPPELTGQYRALEQAGWRRPRVHHWWKCEEARPHAHLIMPGAPAEGRDLILVWDGTTVLDEGGNVVRREP